jgi:hypothetical protein
MSLRAAPLAALVACGPAADTDAPGDTATCPEWSSVYDDECCWDELPESPLPRRVLDVDIGDVVWDESVTVLTDGKALAAWAESAGLEVTPDVDFATEVAVGAIVETRSADGHGPVRELDGLREGDTPGSWYAGFYQALSPPCVDHGPGVHHATLWAAPIGPVDICYRASYCD